MWGFYLMALERYKKNCKNNMIAFYLPIEFMSKKKLNNYAESLNFRELPCPSFILCRPMAGFFLCEGDEIT